MKRKHLVLVGLVLFIALVGSVLATKRVSPMAWGWYGRVNAPGSLLIGGYDPIAYFKTGQPALGDPAITSEWEGATVRFASAADKKLFDKSPAKYAPQIGGFCSFAASLGATAKCNPLAWHIEGGKLYVFNDFAFRDKFVAAIKDGVIAKAEANWAKHLQAVK